MTLKNLLETCEDTRLAVKVTALSYYKEDRSYYSFRSLCNALEKTIIKDYKNEFSNEELALEVKSWYVYEQTLWINVIEWID